MVTSHCEVFSQLAIALNLIIDPITINMNSIGDRKSGLVPYLAAGRSKTDSATFSLGPATAGIITKSMAVCYPVGVLRKVEMH